MKARGLNLWEAMTYALSFFGLYSASLFVWSELNKVEPTNEAQVQPDMINNISPRPLMNFYKWRP